MTEFRAGDKVRVSSTSYVLTDKQCTGTVVGQRSFGYSVKLDNYGWDTDGTLTFYTDELTKISDAPPSSNERLSEAEAKIATLEAEVAVMKQAQNPPPEPKIKVFTSEEFDKAMSKVWDAAMHSVQTPNQRRADVIKRAQAFVADLEERAQSTEHNKNGNHVFNLQLTLLTFHVNAEKGVVTALAKYRTGEIAGKAFAKCHEDDVFNADIGKAIAAGKLYGVDIPQEFLDAPKPTEVVVGMRILYHHRLKYREMAVTKTSSDQFEVDEGGFFWNKRMDDGTCGIIDDSNAVYE